jgi:large subunit ribosomal protein L23
MDLNFVLKKPLITEKSTFLNSQGGYVFQVDPQSTKGEIKKAVERFFKVKVDSVRTINVMGKNKRALKSRRQVQRANWKKAMVFLKEGGKIDLFETGE